MATSDEIKRLEQAVRDAQAALTRARAENQRADEAWSAMVKEANANIARGKPVTGAFITGAAERARAGQGVTGKAVERRKVVPLHEWRSSEHFTGGFYDPLKEKK
jgi:hypothetical protein